MGMSFGPTLRALRQKAGLSQRDLAQRAGLDFSYISKLENERLPPPAADTIVTLCSILGVPADHLLAATHKLPSDVEEHVSASAAAQMFLRKAQSLTEEQWLQLARRLQARIDTPLERTSMLPTLANAYDLSQWANRLDALGYLPELIRRLILLTAGDISHIEMRAGEGTRYEGYDGVLNAGHGNMYVPDGLSVWEMGVNQNPKGKADDDYDKRTADPLDIDPSQAAFVFVTPRRWAGKEDWAAEKRKSEKWGEVRVLDADDLEAWLGMTPVVHVWISRLLGKDPGNVQDLASFWRDWREATQPLLSSELIIAGREAVAEQLPQHLQAPASTVTIQADSQEEAIAFIAAVLERLPDSARDVFFSRTLIVYSADAWRQIALTPHPLILLPAFAPVEPVQATRQGHLVLIPAGPEIAEAPGMLVLQRPARQAAEAALLAMGVKEERAAVLASIAHRSLLSLRRQLAVNPALQQPVWAAREQARSLLPALLAGSWDDALEGDQNAIGDLAGCSYAEVEADLVGYAQDPDPPVRRVGTTWLFTSKEDAWRLLSRFLTRQNLECFRQVTYEVLAMLDPALELPLGERWLANVKGRSRPHSRFLRQGLAETLALQATRPVNNLPTGRGTGQDEATALVTQLLRQANADPSGKLWASLADVLPLLAEAAPDAFLHAMDTAMSADDPVIRKLFTDQSGDPFTTQSAHVSVLWALERLAWSPDYLSSAALYLARLAHLDPSGRLANRPGSSLRQFFLLWWPQTSASPEEQLQVLDLLRAQEPAQAWKLMLSLLPRSGDAATGTDFPRWREWKPEGQPQQFTIAEVWSAAEALVTRLLADAGADSDRLGALLERVADLPSPLREKIISTLESLEPARFEQVKRETLRTKLRTLIAHHRQFPQASWAMPAADVDRLATVYERFAPIDLIQQVAWLFTGVPLLIESAADAPQEQREAARYTAQVAAVQQVYQAQGLSGLMALLDAIEQPGVLGWVLGKSGLIEEEDHLLVELSSPDARRQLLAHAYVAGSFQARGWEWVDRKLATSTTLGTPDRRARFFRGLPAKAETWDRLEQWTDETASLYWTRFTDLVASPEESMRAAQALITQGQPWRAVDVVAHHIEKLQPDAEFLLTFLEQVVETPLNQPIDQILRYELGQLLDYLERIAGIDEFRLAKIELALLPLFKYEHHPFKALHHQLAIDPEFFVALVSLAYRASDEAPHEVDELEQARASIAYDLLHAASVVPGTQDGDQLDPTALNSWVGTVRQLLAERKREDVGDLCIGQLLSHAKPDADGVWPPPTIRDLLETLHSDEIEEGIELAIYNARGVTWRNPTDGGAQERQFVEQYRSQADALRSRSPRAAAMLRRLTQRYEEEARWHDHEAELRQNGW